ncbi:18367_t:CDS:2 [Dentiscutata erythropus]|uniref:18367_t:CDS:1 n=1 Tax=Dentiscutata erythropus TaxID=1348616 RepID=A0A9N9HR13_9GLOM|nr:18367_t:CDS:2 [Dentiscutata erythropus]
MNNWLAIISDLCENTLEIIKAILNEFNPFVINFRSIAANNNIDNLCLIIKANHGLDQRTYNIPTASQVAAIWVESYYPVGFVKQDIIGNYSWHPGILQHMSQKKIETEHLNYLRFNQDKLRKELYQGLHNSYQSGITNATNVGT